VTDNNHNNQPPNGLTGIHPAYTMGHQNDRYDEVSALMVNHFLNTLAEVSLAVAARLNQGEEKQP